MLVSGLDRGQLLEIFHAFALGRAADEHAFALAADAMSASPGIGRRPGHSGGGNVGRNLGAGVGRDAGPIGSAYALRRRTDGSGDIISPSGGATGAVFLLGGTPLDFFRQQLGRAGAPARGRSVGSHWTDFGRGLLGGVAPPGTMLEVMAGITLAFRLRGEDRVGIAYAERGCTATGAWHEGLNFAAVQRCPMIVMVEAVDGAEAALETRVSSFTEQAEGYGIAAETLDGDDVLAVYEATTRAVERARAGEGVTLLELGHAPAPTDPIERFRALLLEKRMATQGELNAIAARAEADILRAAEQARAEEEPAGADAVHDVLTDHVAPSPGRGPANPPRRTPER